ncbi:hypothetical protein F5X96DRAFT_669133 [Biscogniauxia mediterranea]|nr:hypothetical protein F5X96DRAFT_669133 [Biscogniauxia mediterranea]
METTTARGEATRNKLGGNYFGPVPNSSGYRHLTLLAAPQRCRYHKTRVGVDTDNMDYARARTSYGLSKVSAWACGGEFSGWFKDNGMLGVPANPGGPVL